MKKKSTKYSKLLVVAAKELATKKKSLVGAERSLAKAKQKHEELIAEVARLDMVERSLKALVDGTEPPTNVRYVYQYPQWVWYQQPYITYTVPQYQQPGYWLNGQWQAPVVQIHNADMSGVQNFQTSGNMSINTTPAIATTNTLTGTGVITNVGTSSFTANCSSGLNASNVSLTNGTNSVPTWTTNEAASTAADFIVDLTTNATQEEVPAAKCKECGGEYDGAIEMHRLECSKAKETEAAKA